MKTKVAICANSKLFYYLTDQLIGNPRFDFTFVRLSELKECVLKNHILVIEQNLLKESPDCRWVCEVPVLEKILLVESDEIILRHKSLHYLPIPLKPRDFRAALNDCEKNRQKLSKDIEASEPILKVVFEMHNICVEEAYEMYLGIKPLTLAPEVIFGWDAQFYEVSGDMDEIMQMWEKFKLFYAACSRVINGKFLLMVFDEDEMIIYNYLSKTLKYKNITQELLEECNAYQQEEV